MKFIFTLLTILLTTSLTAQSDQNAAESDSYGTHLMGSGSKSVDGAGVNKDIGKYKDLRKKSKSELQKEEVGKNPTSTDTIQGENSKKISH